MQWTLVEYVEWIDLSGSMEETWISKKRSMINMMKKQKLMRMWT
jgi:hypothetical protein